MLSNKINTHTKHTELWDGGWGEGAVAKTFVSIGQQVGSLALSERKSFYVVVHLKIAIYGKVSYVFEEKIYRLW